MQKKHESGEGKLTTVVDRFEGEKAVLVADTEEIVLSKKLLPAATKTGDTLVITFMTDHEDRQKREKEVRDLLNQILRGEK